MKAEFRIALFCATALYFLSGNSFAYYIGVFPEFGPYWESPTTPFVASGVHLETFTPGDARTDHEISTTTGETVEASRTIGSASTSAKASTALGLHRAYATGSRVIATTANSASVSLWKDSFTLAGDGTIGITLALDGSVPMSVSAGAGFGAAGVELWFGIYGIGELQPIIFGHFTATQHWDEAFWEWTAPAELGGFPMSHGETFTRHGEDAFNLSLEGVLGSGEYQIRSTFWAFAAPNDLVLSATADYFNTAEFEAIALSPGMSLVSASGLLRDAGGGRYQYVSEAQPSDVPEPATLALLAFGFGALGFVSRRRFANRS